MNPENNNVLNLVLGIAVVAILAFGGWWIYSNRSQDVQNLENSQNNTNTGINTDGDVSGSAGVNPDGTPRNGDGTDFDYSTTGK